MKIFRRYIARILLGILVAGVLISAACSYAVEEPVLRAITVDPSAWYDLKCQLHWFEQATDASYTTRTIRTSLPALIKHPNFSHIKHTIEQAGIAPYFTIQCLQFEHAIYAHASDDTIRTAYESLKQIYKKLHEVIKTSQTTYAKEHPSQLSPHHARVRGALDHGEHRSSTATNATSAPNGPQSVDDLLNGPRGDALRRLLERQQQNSSWMSWVQPILEHPMLVIGGLVALYAIYAKMTGSWPFNEAPAVNANNAQPANGVSHVNNPAPGQHQVPAPQQQIPAQRAPQAVPDQGANNQEQPAPVINLQ